MLLTQGKSNILILAFTIAHTYITYTILEKYAHSASSKPKT